MESVNAVLEALGFPNNERIKSMSHISHHLGDLAYGSVDLVNQLYTAQARDGLITKEHFLNGMSYLVSHPYLSTFT